MPRSSSTSLKMAKAQREADGRENHERGEASAGQRLNKLASPAARNKLCRSYGSRAPGTNGVDYAPPLRSWAFEDSLVQWLRQASIYSPLSVQVQDHLLEHGGRGAEQARVWLTEFENQEDRASHGARAYSKRGQCQGVDARQQAQAEEQQARPRGHGDNRRPDNGIGQLQGHEQPRFADGFIVLVRRRRKTPGGAGGPGLPGRISRHPVPFGGGGASST
jgi:hypothetical protein